MDRAPTPPGVAILRRGRIRAGMLSVGFPELPTRWRRRPLWIGRPPRRGSPSYGLLRPARRGPEPPSHRRRLVRLVGIHPCPRPSSKPRRSGGDPRCGQAITQRQHPTQAGRPSAKPDMTRVDEWVAAHTLLSPCLKRSVD